MILAYDTWMDELKKMEAEEKADPSLEGLVEKAVSERFNLEKRIVQAEANILEVSERRTTEKAKELLERYKEELSKAKKDEDDDEEENKPKKGKDKDGKDKDGKDKDTGPKGTEPKTYMFDPFQLMESLGFKERIMSMSYDTLRLMSERNPIIAAIINTRIHQITAFSRPPKDDFDIGFELKMREDYAKPGKEDTRKEKELSDMIESTGLPGIIEEEERDTFDQFLSKEVRDTLTYDQMCFEMVPGRNGKPVAFYAIDASTIRFATTPRILQRIAGYGTEQLKQMWKREMMQVQQGTGERRSPKPQDVRYVQVISGKVMNTYDETEMAFGIRNPRTSIAHNSYGVGELEILISVITSHLWAEEYNKRFFSTGSAPKGFIHFESTQGIGVPQEQLNAFRRQWHAQVTGVWNAWRTPIISSPAKMQYTNLQMSNRQMEFTNWIEYLIKLMCAVYLIDPAEINFDLKGAAGQQGPMFESPSEQKLKMSRDRGLKPLVRFFESEINKNILYQVDPRYEFQFVGLDSKSEKDIQELRIKSLEKYKVLDEVRAEEDLPPLTPELGGDLIMDSSYIQYRIQKMQMASQAAMGGMGGAPDFGQEEPGETGEQGPEGEAGGPSRFGEFDNTMSKLALERNSPPEGERPESRNSKRLSELDEIIASMKKTKGGEEEEEKPKKKLKKSRRVSNTLGYPYGRI
jgi:hypothetical protein